MGTSARLEGKLGPAGGEGVFRLGSRTYRVVAYPDAARPDQQLRWDLYLEGRGERPRLALSFGVSNSIEQLLDAVVAAANAHAEGEKGVSEPVERRARSFRPGPSD